jgi:hypothetical protein
VNSVAELIHEACCGRSTRSRSQFTSVLDDSDASTVMGALT